MPARGVLGGLGALGHADDLAVLEGDLVVFKQLEGIRSSTGAADQHTADGVGIAAEVNGQALVVKHLRLDLNSVAVAALQQLHGIAVLGRRDGLREGLVTGTADCGNDIRIKNRYTVNYQLAGRIGNKAAVQVRLTLRKGLVGLGQGVAGRFNVCNRKLTDTNSTSDNTNAPIFSGTCSQLSICYLRIVNNLISCRVAACMTDETTNRTGCSANIAILNRGIRN